MADDIRALTVGTVQDLKIMTLLRGYPEI
jgi:hypothetical protein